MEDTIKPLDCPHCGEKVNPTYDENLNLWDCVHFCYSRLFGAINYPDRQKAVEEWNKVAKKEGGD